MPGVSGEDLYQDREYDLRLRLVGGAKGLRKKIRLSQVQKLGLAVAGYTRFVQPFRVQVIGNTELSYLATLPPERRDEIIRKICGLRVACFIVTKNLEIPPLLIQESEKKRIPLFQTELGTLELIERITRFLEDKLAARTTIHGVLVDVFGVGVLIVGRSGIGKSECALDLVLKGHRFVADDLVLLYKTSPGAIFGCGTDPAEYHMEIRGLGIISIAKLFGVEAIRERKKVEVVVELIEWESSRDYDRLGFEDESYRLLEIDLPLVRIPVTPGRNVASIVEVAARNHILKAMGYHPAREFEKQLLAKMAGRRKRKTTRNEAQ
ncbi:MAG: HPr(Ser) kinase/phosphatase [Deltaproteobacteria bacterium]|nr:HPr(Ser) kinase/phosphatase [Deltaproteobacteria bacterium]MBW2121890.1 HPr(Ser) kinase/phosphatase [Deltaproteobacteria bacterium]